MKSEIPLDIPNPNNLGHRPLSYGELLVASPKGAALCRRAARHRLTAWGLRRDAAESYHSALLVVGELAANAITHGRVPGRGFRFDLTLSVGLLRIEVSDCRGDRLPAIPPDLSPNSQSGRGLTLVAALSSRWGSRPLAPGGKTVWAEIDLPAAVARAER